MTDAPQEEGRRRSSEGGGRPPAEPERREISDLIGAEVTVALMLWFVIMLAAFFLIGPVVGLIVLVAGLVGFGWAAVSAIRRADTSD